MKKVHEFARQHTILYCVLVEIVAVGLAMLFGVLLGILTVDDKIDFYVLQSVQELVAVLINLFFLYVSGLFPVLKHKGSGFGKGIVVGLYMLVTAIFAGLTFVSAYIGELQPRPAIS